MILSLAIAVGLADRCAPRVAKATLLSVAYHESRLDTLAIRDNTTGRDLHPRTRVEAVQTARMLIDRGHSIDMGIGQINSRTAPGLGLTVVGAFDGCQNMAAAGAMMERSYRKVAGAESAQRSLAAMLSIYNTGNSWRGFDNGYVGHVYRAAATIVPQLGRTAQAAVDPASIDPILSTGRGLSASNPRASAAVLRVPATVAAERPASPPWAAFGNPANVMVFGTNPADAGPFDRKEKSE